MNILYFTNIPSPYKVDFLNELSKYTNITCIFNNNSKDDKRDERWYNNNFHFESIFVNKFAYNTFNKILDLKKFDVIIIAYYACINAVILMNSLKKRNIPFIISADGGFINRNDSPISFWLKKHFLSKATNYITSGKETDKYIQHYSKADSDCIYHIPFTSLRKEDICNKPLSTKEKQEIRKELGYHYNNIFISVGNFIPRKGYDLFLKSIVNNSYEDTLFLIIGGGIEKEKYQKFINANNIKNVKLIDYLDKPTLWKYYKMSDVFFFPSKEDVWGLVINEAMANGLPVISSDNVIAAKELIDSNYLFNTNILNEHKKMIDKMLSYSKDELFTIGEKNINTIKNYTIENMAKKHLNIFIEVAQHVTH